MSVQYQHTIKKPFVISGYGLHTGKKVNVKFASAEPNTGIAFKRFDISNIKKIIPNPYLVSNTDYCINIKKNNIKINSVEHVLSVLFGLGVDNCVVEFDNEEFPALDGSVKPLLQKLLRSGLQKQNAKKKILQLNKVISANIDGRWIIGIPSDSMRITIAVEYNHPAIGRQWTSFLLSKDYYIKNIAYSRTFGIFDEIKKEKKMGLVKGGNMQNALVYDRKKLVNPKMQRYSDEVVRHKALDLLGALALTGHYIKAHIIGFKTGHTLDVKFARELLKNSTKT